MLFHDLSRGTAEIRDMEVALAPTDSRRPPTIASNVNVESRTFVTGSPLEATDLYEEDNSGTTSDLAERNKRSPSANGTNAEANSTVCEMPAKIPDTIDLVDRSGHSAGSLNLGGMVGPLENLAHGAHKKADENAGAIKAHGFQLNELDEKTRKHSKEIADIWTNLSTRVKEAAAIQEQTDKLKGQLASAQTSLNSLGNAHDQDAAKKTGAATQALHGELQKLEKIIGEEKQKKIELENAVNANKGENETKHKQLEEEIKEKGRIIERLLDAQAMAKGQANKTDSSLSDLWTLVRKLDAENKARIANLERDNALLNARIESVRTEIFNEMGEIFFNTSSRLKQLAGTSTKPAGNQKGDTAEDDVGNLNDVVNVRQVERLLVQVQFPPSDREGAKVEEMKRNRNWLVHMCTSGMRRLFAWFVCVFTWNCKNKKEAVFEAAKTTQQQSHKKTTDAEQDFAVIIAEGILEGNVVNVGGRICIMARKRPNSSLDTYEPLEEESSSDKENFDAPVEFIKTQMQATKGPGVLLAHEGHLYWHQKGDMEGCSFWKCVLSRKHKQGEFRCSTVLQLHKGFDVIGLSAVHVHDGIPHVISQRKAIAELDNLHTAYGKRSSVFGCPGYAIANFCADKYRNALPSH
ncbi:hypothetical protein DdX_06803 [Ditylenchus destructor]|uniref:Uncharacterized protein n=1 Tax=Ditylenchus destructor TaxID=166010 RepID=A0AAD4R8B0_9BILA|nr:hypothetical protein DdX_06803 [Ditylenchus destructor]